MKPVPAPTTIVPSMKPSMTGLVATFDVAKTVTSSLSDAEISAIEAEVITSFGVTPAELSTTGTIYLMSVKILIVSVIFRLWIDGSYSRCID